MTTTATEDPKILNFADIESADDVQFTEVKGFKAGEVFKLRSLTADDMIEWTEANGTEQKRTAGLRLIVKSLCGQDGQLHVDNTNTKAVERAVNILRKKSHKITEGLVREIVKFNGMRIVTGGKMEGEEQAKKD